jgi:hypothetical protein
MYILIIFLLQYIHEFNDFKLFMENNKYNTNNNLFINLLSFINKDNKDLNYINDIIYEIKNELFVHNNNLLYKMSDNLKNYYLLKSNIYE